MTITTGPVPVPSAPGDQPGAGGISDGTSPILPDDFALWEHEHSSAPAGGCLHPVKLRGRSVAIDLASGELRPVFDTATEPGGVIRTACGNRRETVCPPCSAVYKRDARQLVRAGLSGGKGLPDSIARHPCVFATLTAPSFGPVHARRMRGSTVLPCRPRRDARQRRCPHGRDISCARRHGEHDPRLGHALCPDCYDYTAAVLFNAYAGQLWRRFTTYLPRYLARQAGLTLRAFRELATVRYVKVAEYQARGIVHFHAVIRLDTPGGDYQPPPGWLEGNRALYRLAKDARNKFEARHCRYSGGIREIADQVTREIFDLVRSAILQLLPGLDQAVCDSIMGKVPIDVSPFHKLITGYIVSDQPSDPANLGRPGELFPALRWRSDIRACWLDGDDLKFDLNESVTVEFAEGMRFEGRGYAIYSGLNPAPAGALVAAEPQVPRIWHQRALEDGSDGLQIVKRDPMAEVMPLIDKAVEAET